MDGSPVERKLWQQDYVLLTIAHGNNNSVTYYYVKCYDMHNWFEYAGEVEEEDSV